MLVLDETRVAYIYHKTRTSLFALMDCPSPDVPSLVENGSATAFGIRADHYFPQILFSDFSINWLLSRQNLDRDEPISLRNNRFKLLKDAFAD